MREKILKYAWEKYQTQGEYLWKSSPTFAVLRRGDNQKWYGVLMEIPAVKLGLKIEGNCLVINLKCDEELIENLLGGEGFFPAWHMNKRKWLTVLLDGSVALDEVFRLIDLSYFLVGNK